MKKLTLLAIFAVSALGALAQTHSEKQQLLSRIEDEISTDVLSYWLDHAPDGRGGFCGLISADGVGDPDAPRGSVLAGRLLWTFSSAYRLYGLPDYKQMADMMQRYYIDRFIDPVYGGSYWTIDGDGHPLDATKQAYATAFGIYGLSEHFRATGDRTSLDKALSLYHTLNDRMLDRKNGGYFEAGTRDFAKPALEGVDGRKDASKTMNTHIHILEALTNLYRVSLDTAIAEDIRALIGILGSQLYDTSTGHLVIFCDEEWRQLDNIESYGHDIETSWLLTEAAEALADPVLLAQVQHQAVAMTDAALRDGMGPDNAMYYEKTPQGFNRKLSWWVQCETVVGCLNAWEITGERRYYDQAVRTWQYIRDNFVDSERGEWYHNTSPMGRPFEAEPKGSLWNCPYHNSRMAFEAGKRLSYQGARAEVMAWSNITGIRRNGHLVDFETSLAVGTPGARIEHTGRERQQNVRYRRDGLSQIVDIPLDGAHFSQTVTDAGDNSVDVCIVSAADTTDCAGAYWCISLPKTHYSDAKISIKGRKIAVKGPHSAFDLVFDRAVKTRLLDSDSCTQVYVTLLPTLNKDETANLNVRILLNQVKSTQEPAHITLDLGNPGNRFIGFGGNFRIQNPQLDPKAIDYCLDNMNVAMGRVEFPWAAWDRGGADDPHVQQSARMARRLAALGMPVVVSCWFPPQWALEPGSVRHQGGVAALRLDPAKSDSIYEQLASYLEYLKTDWGVEAAYFSFNESDIGIDVLHTPEEHCRFIKDFGAKLASRHLACKLLLGDNSDATTTSFTLPALNDPEAQRYIGAVSFHSWRGCDDKTLQWWHDAAASINVPLLVGEGSTDAAAWRYPQIFAEPTFALYEINLYTRLCAICQPISILQWQLTADYPLVRGQGILRDNGPLRPTQRFYNLQQLSRTPDSFAIPATSDCEDINVAAMYNVARGEGAVHIVNNGGATCAKIEGMPSAARYAIVYTTNIDHNSEALYIPVIDGMAELPLAPESFVSVMIYSAE